MSTQNKIALARILVGKAKMQDPTQMAHATLRNSWSALTEALEGLLEIIDNTRTGPDRECLTLPDGDCVAESCLLHNGKSLIENLVERA